MLSTDTSACRHKQCRRPAKPTRYSGNEWCTGLAATLIYPSIMCTHVGVAYRCVSVRAKCFCQGNEPYVQCSSLLCFM